MLMNKQLKLLGNELGVVIAEVGHVVHNQPPNNVMHLLVAIHVMSDGTIETIAIAPHLYVLQAMLLQPRLEFGLVEWSVVSKLREQNPGAD